MLKEGFIFTDESCITNPDKRYSAICALSGDAEFFKENKDKILSIMKCQTEYKFQKLNNEIKNDILTLCNGIIFPAINQNKIRIDVLIWDNVIYVKNQETMHYHLLKKVLERYPKGVTWHYYPDHDRGKDYTSITKIVDRASNTETLYQLNLEELAREYVIKYTNSLDSKDYKLIQITDIFAGLGAFSYNYYNDYTDWKKNTTGALCFDLFQQEVKENKIAQKYHCRFSLLDEINEKCKKYNKSHSITSKQGLSNFDPIYGMNFWLWDKDKSRFKKA